MKIIKILILRIIFIILLLPLTVKSQQTVNSILSDVKTHNKFILYKVVDLLELVPNRVDSILFYAKEKQNSAAVVALGYLASNEDRKVISFLNSLANTNSNGMNTAYASHAIFRIGGEAMDNHLDFIFSMDNFKLQANAIEYLWVTDNLADCEILNKHLLSVKKNHPEWRINKFIDVTFRRHFDFSIWVQNEKDKSKVFDELVDILRPTLNGPFHAVPGPITYVWSVKMLNRNIENKEKVLAYMKERKDQLKDPTVKESFLFYLDQWDYELTNIEIKWLNNDRDRILTNGFRLNNEYILFRSKEELLQYYSFRKKYANKNVQDKH